MTRVSAESLRSDCGCGRNYRCQKHPDAHSRSFDEPKRPFYAEDSAPSSQGPSRRAPSPNLQTPTLIPNHVRTPTIVTPTDSKLLQQPRSAFANGVPSPPLEPEDLRTKKGAGPDPLRAVVSEPHLDADCHGTWFLDDEPDSRCSTMSEHVRQLIKETDDAFQAVNAALAEAKQAYTTPHSSSEEVRVQQPQRPVLRAFPVITPQPAIPSPSQLMSPLSPSSGAGRGTVASPRKTKASTLSPLSPAFRKSPTSSSPITKNKRANKSPKVQALHRSASHEPVATSSVSGSPGKGSNSVLRPHHSYTRSLNKLNLAADKVTDKIFEGRSGRFVFHKKIEADEVVTPSQIQQFKKTRLAKEAEARRTASNETLRSVVCAVGESNNSLDDTDNNDAARVGMSTLLSPVIELSSPESLSAPSDKGTSPPQHHSRSMTPPSDPRTPTKDAAIKMDHDPLLATPPATPPQLPSTFSTAAAAEEDENRLMQQSKPTIPKRRPGHTRSNSSTSHIPLLPTIPEVRITAPEASDIAKGRRSTTPDQTRPPLTPDEAAFFHEDDEHMFFVSTPWTATAPAFQHGKIRLAKADLVHAGTINSLESRLLTSPDETLDWTAFQMAILGGAGDLFSDPENFLARDAQEQMVDDLCDWFEDLGFSGSDLGSLVVTKADDPSLRKPRPAQLKRITHHRFTTSSPAAMTASTPGSTTKAFHDPSSIRCPQLTRADSPESSADELTTLPIPISSEHPSGFWNTAPFDENQKQKFAAGSGSIKRWTLEGHPKRPSVDVGRVNSDASLLNVPEMDKKDVRGSVESLPQSPMLDLRMTTAVDGTRELVPMGYNLGHDLGDFLKWEAEHVYASGFYGAD